METHSQDQGDNMLGFSSEHPGGDLPDVPKNPPLKKTVPAAERKALAIQRLQMAYRVHLARRQYRRKKKLQVFAQESRAAIVIQCLFRKKEAEKRVARKRALAHFAKFMSNLRPSLRGSGLSEDEMLAFAAVKVQAAWRRRQAYFARVRAKNRKGFYNLIKQRRQGKAISDAEIEDLAATFIQSKFRGRRGYFEGVRRREAMRQKRRHRAAVTIQSWFKGVNTRGRLRREANERKMKRLAGFFSNVCFMKCFLIWERFKTQQLHMKEVLGRVMVRLTKRGMFMGFLMMKHYVEAKKEKRVALNKAAAHLFGAKNQARDDAFCAWKDLLSMDEETNKKVAEKMAKFLGMGAAAMLRRCFDCWGELAAKKRKALWKWKNSVLVRAWHEYKDIVGVMRSNGQLLARVRLRWLNWSLVVGMARWRFAVEDRKWARHVIVHAVWRFSMREQAMPFDALAEHAALCRKERAIRDRFARRFKLRTCHLMLLEWHHFAAEEVRRRDIIGKARFRLQNQAAVGCMNEWKGIVQDRKIEQREQLAQGSAALMRWIKRPMVDGFRAWVELVAKMKNQRQKTRKLMWRIQNACVVSTWEAWQDFLVALSVKRREALSEAVRAALVAGSLMSLLQMARSQPKAYREMLHEVMQEHFESEGSMVASLAGAGAGGDPRKPGGKKTFGKKNGGVSDEQVAYTKEALRAMWEQNLDDTCESPNNVDDPTRSGHTSPPSSHGMSPIDVATMPPAQFVLPPDSRSGSVPQSPGLSQIAPGDLSASHASFLDSQPLRDLEISDGRQMSTRVQPRGGPGQRADTRAERAAGARLGKSKGQEKGGRGEAGGKARRKLQPPEGPKEVQASGAGVRQILPAYLQAAQGGEAAGRSYGRAAVVGTRRGGGGGGRSGLKGGRHRVEEIEGVLRESVDDLEGMGRIGGGMAGVRDDGRPHSEGSAAAVGGMGGEGAEASGTWGPGGGGPMPVMVDEWEVGAEAAHAASGKTMAEVSASIEMFERKTKTSSMRKAGQGGAKKVGWAGGNGHGSIPMPVLSSDEEEDDRDRDREQGQRTRLPAIVQRGDLVQVSAEQAWGVSRRDTDVVGPDGRVLPAIQPQPQTAA